MPCRLLTFHAYGSWMPDHRRGYVRRRQGILPPDPRMAARYRRRAAESPVQFDAEVQRAAIDVLVRSQDPQRFDLHAIACDPTHLHILISWRDDRPPRHMQTILKTSLTRHLNAHLTRRRWFSENASRKPVSDRAHFDHLIRQYLPSHRGIFYLSPRLTI